MIYVRRLGASLLALAACFVPMIAIAQVSATPFTAGTRYDVAGRVTGTIAPDPDGAGPLQWRAVRNTYDTAGRLVKAEQGQLSTWQSEAVAPSSWGPAFTVLSTTEKTWDSLDQQIKELTRGSDDVIVSVTQYSYDAMGRVECTAVRMNPAIYGALPTSACSLGVEGSNGPDRITRNIYDAAGQLIQLRKAVGTPLEQANATYSYTANGNREYVIDANGNRAKLEYDGFDRQVKWIFPSTTRPSAYNPATQATALATAGSINTGDYEQYAYDANGNRTALRKRDGQVIGYSYDALNRMIVKDVPGTATGDVYYSYDLRGLQTYARLGSPSGEGITSSWNGFGRLTSSANSMGGTTRTLGYQYDANGNRVRLTFPDGHYFTYEYDGLDRMVRIRENGSTEIAGFTYNSRGERTGISGGFGTGFSYDGVGRLAGITHDLAGTAQDVAFCMGTISGSTCNPAYNPAGQILSRTVSNNVYVWNGHFNVNRTYATNGLNQYMSAGSASFTYGANGNLTSDGSSVYSYDVENRLTGASGSTNATLSWDPLGRLWQTAGSATTRFLYDGDELVGEYDAGGTLLRRYIHGTGNDDPLVWYEGSGLGDRRHLRTDHQGSIVAVGTSAGAGIAINRYDEYGIPGLANVGRFTYTGQAWIPELGMYHYKARLYSPTLGRFLQTDPIGYDDQINLYAYVQNDPVDRTDPTGTETVGQYFEGVWSDIKDLGSAIGRGDFEYAFGGMPPTLGGGVVSEGLAGVNAARAAVTELRGGAQATAVASQRAAQIHSVLDPIARSRRTTAVLETSGGRVVAGGGRDLTAAQRAALGPGETAARAPGAHAEVTALRQATASGAAPQTLAASRPICSSCAAAIRSSGGTLTSPTTATWQAAKPWWKFW